MKESFINICQTLNLGQFVRDKLIARKLWCVETSLGKFSFKEKPFEKGLKNRCLVIKQLLKDLKKQELPVISLITMQVPSPSGGSCLTGQMRGSKKIKKTSKNSIFLIAPWIAGETLKPNQITCEHAKKIGKVLAQFHKAHSPEKNIDIFDNQYFDFNCNIPWENLLIAARRRETNLSARFIENFPLLIQLEKEALKSRVYFEKGQCISHRDLNPRNVIWENQKKFTVIDWDLMGWIHPEVELVSVALDWGITADQMSEDLISSIYNGYLEVIPHLKLINVEPALSCVLGIWLNWLVVHFRQWVSARDEVKAKVHEKEISYTLDAFKLVLSQKQQILSCFGF